jgi:Response regulator of the LytR/AlgR family
MSNKTVKILIVDDEFHARKLLAGYVSKLPFLELIGAVPNIFDAMTLLQNNQIDVLLLDIQMPEVTGLEFARSLKNPPSIIFTTAYSDYAMESYELQVVDYLLKPIAFPRFLQAIDKVRERRGLTIALSGDSADEKHQITNITKDFITVKDGARVYKINHSDLLFIEGQREYVTFHTAKNKITALYTLKNLEAKLPEELFIRIHKSYIVSFRHIEMIERNQLTIDGKTFPIGNSYKDDLMRRINSAVI